MGAIIAPRCKCPSWLAYVAFDRMWIGRVTMESAILECGRGME